MSYWTITRTELPDPYTDHKVIVIIPAYNEAEKISRVVEKIPKDKVTEILVIDDGSTDGCCDNLPALGASVLRHDERRFIGVAVRNGLRYALGNDYEIIVVLAGNDKDEPTEIPRLLEPLIKGEADFVQGSRYLLGGKRGKMPRHRLWFTKMYSAAVSLCTFTRVTDGTNGFRAYRSEILRDERIDIHQPWLFDSMEYYLSIKVIKLGYRYAEVPVTKLYPQNVHYKHYTKVRPFSGWVERLKPLLFLTLGIRK
jgi:dolichol-phosphate mannosyltransferase